MSHMEMLMLAALVAAAIILAIMLVVRLARSSVQQVRKWRERRSQPDRVAALMAERDGLRAEHAMLVRSYELRIGKLEERFVEQEAEVSRARNRLGRMAEKLQETLDALSERDSEISALREVIAGLESDLEKRTKALHEQREELRERNEEIARLKGEIASLHEQLAGQEKTIGQLREEADMAQRTERAMRIGEDLEPEARLAARIEELNRLARELEEQRGKLAKGAGKTVHADGKKASRCKGESRKGKATSSSAKRRKASGNGKKAGGGLLARKRKSREEKRKKGAEAASTDEAADRWIERLNDLGRGSADDKAGNRSGTDGKNGGEKTEPVNVVSLAERIRALKKSL